MNSCKIMLVQAKSMKSIWLTACGGGAGRVRFQGAKKRPAKGKELNDLVANAVKSVFTTSTRKQAKDLSELVSEDDQDHFNFEKV